MTLAGDFGGGVGLAAGLARFALRGGAGWVGVGSFFGTGATIGSMKTLSGIGTTSAPRPTSAAAAMIMYPQVLGTDQSQPNRLGIRGLEINANGTLEGLDVSRPAVFALALIQVFGRAHTAVLNALEQR